MIAQFLYQLHQTGIIVSLTKEENLALQSPQGMITAEIQAQLKAQKTQIVAFLKQQPLKTEAPFYHIFDIERLPVSRQQQSLLFFYHYQQAIGNEYNMSHFYRLRGQLNQAALKSALQHIVTINPIYRTRFVCDAGYYYQYIDDSLPEVITILPLDETHCQTILQESAQRIFNLETGPLIEFTLFTDGDKQHILAIVQHHIASDGWSVGLLLNQLSVFYQHFSHTDTLPRTDFTALTYGDYTFWQHNFYEKSEDYQRSMAFWQDYLLDALETHIPLNYPRPDQMTFDGTSIILSLDESLARAIHQRMKTHKVSLFIYLFSIYNLLLSRLTAQNDILVGTVFANRGQNVFNQTVGFFANTCVLRTVLHPSQCFSSLLNTSRQNFSRVYAHHQIPFETVVSQVCTTRPVNRLPLVQSVFVAQNAQKEEQLHLEGLECQAYHLPSHSSNFDLVFHLLEKEESIRFYIEYNRQIFSTEGIDVLCQQFMHLICAVTANPNLPLNQYDHCPWRASLPSYSDEHALYDALKREGILLNDLYLAEQNTGEVVCYFAMTDLTHFRRIPEIFLSLYPPQKLPENYRLVKQIPYRSDGEVDITRLQQQPSLCYRDLLSLKNLSGATQTQYPLDLTIA